MSAGRGIMTRVHRYFDGTEWPYAEAGIDGVGISLEGAPTDVEAFLSIVQGESCNPAAARRILADLEAGLVKRTTLMPTIDFNRLGDQLAAVGVRMKVIPPVRPAVSDVVDSEVLARYVGKAPEHMETKELEQLVIDRLAQFEDSMAARQHGWGPFEWLRQAA